MQEFFPFFIILLVAVIFSQAFMRMRVPWVVSLIVGGIIVGPNGLDWFRSDTTIEFLATIGMVLLMFMAGVESKLGDTKGLKKKVATIGGLGGVVPTIAGITVALAFGYEWPTALLLGIIFMSSAVALLVPSFQEHKIIDADLGRTIIASAIIIDAISLLLLSIFLQFTTVQPGDFTALLVYPLAFVALGAFAWLLPKLRWVALSGMDKGDSDMFERELRFTMLMVISLVVFFEFVGLHAIIAGFFAGMILSRHLSNTLLKAKLHALSYGFFVPVFFVSMGASTDMSVFFDGPRALFMMAVIVIVLTGTKFISGYLGGRLAGFDVTASKYVGASIIPQLSTALAVAFLGFGEGLLDQELLSAIVGLAIITSIISPFYVSKLGQQIMARKPEPTPIEDIPPTIIAGGKQSPTTVTDRRVEKQ